MVRRTLVTVALAASTLAPLVWRAPAAGADSGGDRHWACVGETDVNIGVCINDPLPSWPFLGLAPV